uniref:IGv domain-containing protein n=1 Tax=Anopheles maculatus TaxID=74869 RepID=A0A182SNB1_9DIPT
MSMFHSSVIVYTPQPGPRNTYSAGRSREKDNVSWVRHRDIHLLTVGRYTYTSDQRFEAMHSPHTEEWTLRIRYAQRKDSGIYECQISTTPPIGHFVYLTIVGEYYVTP